MTQHMQYELPNQAVAPAVYGAWGKSRYLSLY
jgi:hypothetical protein